MSSISKLSSGYEILEFDELDSTMLTLKDLALSGCDIKTVVRAKKQKNGRGRHGRVWDSPEGNLYFSFLREAEKNIKNNIFAPVFIVALSLAHSIIDVSEKKIIPKIKWPNDILVNKSKIAGILIEYINMKNGKDLLNIGLGVNIISNPKKAIYPSTNLQKENVNISPTMLLNIFLNQFDKINKIYKVDGIEKIFDMWNDLGHKIGESVSVKVRDKKIFGTFNGLSKEGGLLIINEAGIEEVILAGDVFII